MARTVFLAALLAAIAILAVTNPDRDDFARFYADRASAEVTRELGLSGPIGDAIGGAAQVLARSVKRVERVFMLEEFGVPEALWVIEVDHFPVMVTMDSHGGSLHDEVEAQSEARLKELLGLST